MHLGCRQVVRQLVLIQPFRGSNPCTPVLSFLSHCPAKSHACECLSAGSTVAWLGWLSSQVLFHLDVRCFFFRRSENAVGIFAEPSHALYLRMSFDSSVTGWCGATTLWMYFRFCQMQFYKFATFALADEVCATKCGASSRLRCLCLIQVARQFN